MQQDWSKLKVYFYCVTPKSADMAAYHHLAISIAEGLRELGVPFYSNVDYWQLRPDRQEYLFQHDPQVTPDDCSIVVVSLPWFLTGQPFPHELFQPGRKYLTVYLDRQDGSRTLAWEPAFRKFDLVLKTHYCRDTYYPSNFYPWAFGLSNRIVSAVQGYSPFQDRQHQILINFRNKRNAHTVRKSVYRDFVPKIKTIIPVNDKTDALAQPPSDSLDYLIWYQTGKRHYPDYYKRLQSATASACFGGYFVPPFPKDKGEWLSRMQQKLMAILHLKSKHIIQWDSWRLWESFAAGCVVFHVDFEKYRLELPDMPENWKHYIGVDLDNVQETFERISDQPEILERIARAGEEWALQYYAPLPTAQRFLKKVHEICYEIKDS